MYHHHLVRFGALGHVGRFTPVDTVRYDRGTEVVLRTARGLEIGEVLSPDGQGSFRGGTDGSILRGMTIQDRLLQARLQKHKLAAFQDCVAQLNELGVGATLLDVELTFDGDGLYFYFLGDVPPEVTDLTEKLAAVYETRSQIRRFSEQVATGCGPGCGTAESEGNGCGSSCSSCSIAKACGTKRR